MGKKNITAGVYKIRDHTGNMEYKITYYKDKQIFRVFKQFHDQQGEYHRFTMKTVYIKEYEHDLNNLIAYIKRELLGEPISGEQRTVSKSVLQSKQVMNDGSRLDEGVRYHNPQTITSKAEALEQLFKAWEKAQLEEPDEIWKKTNGGNANIGKAHFRRDGIIDEYVYSNEKCKVLFVSAEANDNEYSALINKTPNTVDDYLEFHRTGNDSWRGKMRERLSELYKVICRIDRHSMTNQEASIHFAVMDINKRGGGSDIKNGKHIIAYCKQYAKFIRKEIEIIDPDIVAFIGQNLFNMNLHTQYLGAINDDGKSYFLIKGKTVPILSLWQTCYYQGKNEPLDGYEDNRIVGKQAARCVEELCKYKLIQ